MDLEENLTQFEANNLTDTTKYHELIADHSQILILFSSLILATTILYMITSYLFFNFTRKASNSLHKAMVENIINAVMSFFDGTLIGNIINRFSNDLAIIDEYLPFDIYEFFEVSKKYIYLLLLRRPYNLKNNMYIYFQIFLALCGIIIILATVNVAFLIPAAVVLLILFFIRKYYMPTGRNLQRLESASKCKHKAIENSSCCLFRLES